MRHKESGPHSPDRARSFLAPNGINLILNKSYLNSDIVDDSRIFEFNWSGILPESKGCNKAVKFENFYFCKTCKVKWVSFWSYQCLDDCPSCWNRIDPYKSIKIEYIEDYELEAA